jgi:hypothetical protein
MSRAAGDASKREGSVEVVGLPTSPIILAADVQLAREASMRRIMERGKYIYMITCRWCAWQHGSMLTYLMKLVAVVVE